MQSTQKGLPVTPMATVGSPFSVQRMQLFRLIVDQRGDLLCLFGRHFYIVDFLGMGRGLRQDFLRGFGMDNGITIEANIAAA